MSLLSSIPFLSVKRQIPLQVVSDSWTEREAILKEGVNLFCWKREPISGVSEYLEQVLNGNHDSISFFTRSDYLAIKLEQHRSAWDIDNEFSGEAFWADVFRITRDFMNLSNERSGTVHLKVIDNNACTKFHTDGDSLRMFVTYYGRGTEWLPEKATNRRGLGKSNKIIVKDPSMIQRLSSFDVGILKGQVHGSRSGVRGIVHRSPEIKRHGEKRIILRVDI